MVYSVVLEGVGLLHDAIETVGLRREQPPPVLGRVEGEQRLKGRIERMHHSVEGCMAQLSDGRSKTLTGSEAYSK